MENTRFHPGEEKNDPDFARRLAGLGDVYVNDAFSAAHRAHASTEGIAHLLPAFAGRAMEAELRALAAALEAPRRPLTAVVGGAKVSTKLDLLANLTARVDRLAIGGAMANTFLAARGVPVGRSLSEPDLYAAALNTLAEAESRGCEVLLPVDARIAGELRPGVQSRLVAIDAVDPDSMILDIGPRTVELVDAALDRSATLVWNGPFGAFETPPFDEGTIAVARHAARLTRDGRLVSIAGGGDTVAALNKAHAADDFTYVSTAGGAFLEWLEGKTLPGIKVLQSGRQDQRMNRGNQ
jgi:phosphoglycerate kinase